MPMIDDAVYKLTTFQRAMILIFVTLGTIIYSSSILVASALLPKMQGSLGATQDEVSWTVTFNIVATAVVTPMTGWIADRVGRRNTMVWCSAAFGASTFLCGTATSLEELIFWRVVQGAAGAPLVPLGQTLLLDSNPSRHHGLVTAIFGMANVIGPVLGPTIGGEVSEIYGWRWGFWMMVPIAFVTSIGFQFVLPTSNCSDKPWTGDVDLLISPVIDAQLSRGLVTRAAMRYGREHGSSRRRLGRSSG